MRQRGPAQWDEAVWLQAAIDVAGAATTRGRSGLAREPEGPAYRFEEALILRIVLARRRGEEDHVAARPVERGQLEDVISVAARRRPGEGGLDADRGPPDRRGLRAEVGCGANHGGPPAGQPR